MAGVKRRFLLLAPIASVIAACTGSNKQADSTPAPAVGGTTTGSTAPTIAPAPFATVHWIHATS